MTRAGLVAAAGALAACGPLPAPRGPGPQPAAGGVDLAPALPGAERYNDPAAVAAAAAAGDPNDRVAALVAEAAAAGGRDAPRRDARLDAACAELARVLPDEGATPFDLVEFTLQHAGIIEPPPHLVVAVFSGDAMAGFEADLRERLPGVLKAGRYRRLGVGSIAREGGRRVVLAFQETFLTTDPFPRRLPSGASARLRGEVAASFARPRIFITRPDGQVDKLPPGPAGRRFDAMITCAADGKYQVEVTAEDPFGATVLANFPVYCGVAIPRRALIARGDDGAVVDAAAAEQRLLELVNADRQRAGQPPLAWDPALAAVARAHCRDMQDHDFVGHVSPTTGSPVDRTGRAGIRATVVLENVARAYSLGEAQRGLMQSPGHRRNVLAAGVTLAGIGVTIGREVAGRRELFVTQLFIAR
ncbi:MAG TPA: CAP domain-containing protein [Polyangia bacterium]